MRTLLLISALAGAVRGNESEATTVRQKLLAKILETAPPPPPAAPAVDQKNDGSDGPAVFLMKPVVVVESKLVQEVAAAIARKEQNEKDERFSPLQGGTIYRFGRVELGGWWAPGDGWTFLRFNQTPSFRQILSTEARLKELQELANLAQDRAPTPKRNETKFSPSRRTPSDR